MSKVFLARGAVGELVRKLQRALGEKGFDPKGVDGDFGNNTLTALLSFQQASQLAASGEVDTSSWTGLTGQPMPNLRERCLQLTARFEGHDFTLAQGNFDGAGVTWGVIGFTLKHGELGKIVFDIQRSHPELVAAAFGDHADELLSVLRSSREERLRWADSITLSDKVRIAEPWRSAFARFGELAEVQAKQLELADEDYYQPALTTAQELGLTSELGIALCFDIHVQNGGVKADARRRLDRDLDRHPTGGNEQITRILLAHAVADEASAEYREDVRARKLAIAVGAGRVHGSLYVLRNWGLDESPAVAGP